MSFVWNDNTIEAQPLRAVTETSTNVVRAVHTAGSPPDADVKSVKVLWENDRIMSVTALVKDHAVAFSRLTEAPPGGVWGSLKLRMTQPYSRRARANWFASTPLIAFVVFLFVNFIVAQAFQDMPPLMDAVRIEHVQNETSVIGTYSWRPLPKLWPGKEYRFPATPDLVSAVQANPNIGFTARTFGKQYVTDTDWLNAFVFSMILGGLFIIAGYGTYYVMTLARNPNAGRQEWNELLDEAGRAKTTDLSVIVKKFEMLWDQYFEGVPTHMLYHEDASWTSRYVPNSERTAVLRPTCDDVNVTPGEKEPEATRLVLYSQAAPHWQCLFTPVPKGKEYKRTDKVTVFEDREGTPQVVAGMVGKRPVYVERPPFGRRPLLERVRVPYGRMGRGIIWTTLMIASIMFMFTLIFATVEVGIGIRFGIVTDISHHIDGSVAFMYDDELVTVSAEEANAATFPVLVEGITYRTDTNGDYRFALDWSIFRSLHKYLGIILSVLPVFLLYYILAVYVPKCEKTALEAFDAFAKMPEEEQMKNFRLFLDTMSTTTTLTPYMFQCHYTDTASQTKVEVVPPVWDEDKDPNDPRQFVFVLDDVNYPNVDVKHYEMKRCDCESYR